MSRQHGITTETTERIIVDAAQVRVDYVDSETPGTLLGATRGGSTFTIETEYKEIAADGQKGPTKGFRRITKVTAKMVCNFLEFYSDLIQIALPGSTKADSPTVTPTHDEITRALQLAAADHIDTIVMIGEVSGSAQPVILGLKNALSTGGFEVGLTDGDESVMKIEFTGHFDPASMDAEPWFIRYPQDVNPTTEGA